MEAQFDERGYEIATDENGEPMEEQALDVDGNPMVDEYGEPVMEYAASYSCMQTDEGAVDTSVWTGYGRVLT